MGEYMSFEEKSTWIELTCVVLVYSWYFFTIVSQLGSTPVGLIEYQGKMLTTVGILIGLMVAAYILVFSVAPDTDDSSDERDREINRYGEYVGSFALTALAFTAMALAMMEFPHFWIANAVLFGLVVAEIVADGTKILLYRRGSASW